MILTRAIHFTLGLKLYTKSCLVLLPTYKLSYMLDNLALSLTLKNVKTAQ